MNVVGISRVVNHLGIEKVLEAFSCILAVRCFVSFKFWSLYWLIIVVTKLFYTVNQILQHSTILANSMALAAISIKEISRRENAVNKLSVVRSAFVY